MNKITIWIVAVLIGALLFVLGALFGQFETKQRLSSPAEPVEEPTPVLLTEIEYGAECFERGGDWYYKDGISMYVCEFLHKTTWDVN